jgi:hypothetical protein
MNDDRRKLSTERVFELYGEQEMSITLNLLNATTKDNNIILNNIIRDENFFKNFRFREIEKKLKIFMDEIRNNSLKPYCLMANIKNTPIENNLVSNSEFEYNKFYLTPLLFPYLIKQNSFFFKGNYAIYNSRFQTTSSAMKEDELSACVEYSQKASKLSYFLSSLLFFNIGNNMMELDTKFKTSKSERDIKRKQNTSVFKAILSKNFIERPFIFRENIRFDEINKLNFQYAHKIIKNYVDEFNCSPELISKLPQEDSQHHLKLFYVYNKTNFESGDVSYLKLGTSVINTLNSTYLKSKLFYRKFFFSSPFIYQFNCELGNVSNLNGVDDNLRIHEKLFIHGFRGVVNPSRKVIMEEGKNIIYIINYKFK